MITLLNELGDMHGQMSAICAVLIFFKDKESVCIQYCPLTKCLFALWTPYKHLWDGVLEDDIVNMIFK